MVDITDLQAVPITKVRTLRSGGLQFCGLNYNSVHVARACALPNGRLPKKVMVQIDTENLEIIHFRCLDTNDWLSVYVRTDQVARVRGRSLADYRIIAQARRRAHSREVCDTDFNWTEIYEELQRVRGTLGATSGRVRNRAYRHSGPIDKGASEILAGQEPGASVRKPTEAD